MEISVGILTQPPTPETRNLRRWAIDNINEYAPIKLDSLTQVELKTESLPSVSDPDIGSTLNYTVPPGPRSIEYVVVSDTESPSLRGAINFLAKPTAHASYHYVIGTDGQIEKLVKEEHVAWHAGRSEWEGRTGLNRITIGIGLVHLSTLDGDNWLDLPGTHPAVGPDYPPEQLDALVGLLADILQRYDLQVEQILTKQDIAPDRKRADLFGQPIEHVRARVDSLILSGREVGTVKWFNDSMGFGFIWRASGDDVLVHHSAIQSEGSRSLSEGQRVEFTVVQEEKGPVAKNVRPL